MTDLTINTKTEKSPEPDPLPFPEIDILSWLEFRFGLKSEENLKKAMQDPIFGSSFYNNLEKLGPGDRSLTEIKASLGARFSTKLKTLLPHLPSIKLQAYDVSRIDLKERKFLSKTTFLGGPSRSFGKNK